MKYNPKRKIIYCPRCDTPYFVGNLKSGRRLMCRKCEKVLIVPANINAHQGPLISPDEAPRQFPRDIIRCPQCGNPYDVTNFDAGSRVKCLRCSTSLVIPEMDRAEPIKITLS